MINTAINSTFNTNEMTAPTNRQTGMALVKTTPAESIAYQVAHVLPGRIRFKVPQLIEDEEYQQKLTAVAKADPAVQSVEVNPISGSIAVEYDSDRISDTELRSRFTDWLQLALQAELPPEPINQTEEPELWQRLAAPSVTLGLTGLASLMGVSISPALLAGTVALAAIPVAQRAIESLIDEQHLNVDCLDFAAILITTLQGNFFNSAMMIGLIELGEAIRDMSARSSKQQALDLLGSLESKVWVDRNGEKQEIDIRDVQLGETVIVYPGEQIPVDGKILRGKASIDEQKLTGESMPVLRTKGEMVYASTLVREGRIYIEAERLSNDTKAGQLFQVMQNAPIYDTRIGNYANEIGDRLVIPTFLMAGAMFAFTRNPARAASILTLDCATGIRVSVPTTVLAALTYAARRGILIRSGRALEKLAQVDAVVFDKTGTLTQGEPMVVSVDIVNDKISPIELIELAATAEQRLTHPVAEAVVRYAQEHGARILPRGKWNYHIGQGVQAAIDDKTILVGSRHFLEQSGVDLQKLHKKYRAVQENGHSVIYVASNGKLQGAIAYRDPLRPESQSVIAALRQTEGLDIHLLTGDNKRTATAVAHELGIAAPYTYAEAFPEQKVAVVRGLHSEGKTVAFVGDGINDSPALAYADVSVSLASGSDVARETADVVLMENNLQGLADAIAIARQAMHLIDQNTKIVAAPNLGAMLLATTIGIPPIAATLVNNGSTIVAGLNGLRPLMTNPEQLDSLGEKLRQSAQATEIIESNDDAIVTST